MLYTLQKKSQSFPKFQYSFPNSDSQESDRDRETRIGPTNDDEMCNFYLMYYTEGGDPVDGDRIGCWSDNTVGFPQFFFKKT